MVQGPQPDAAEEDTPESGKAEVGGVGTGVVRGMDLQTVLCCWCGDLGRGGMSQELSHRGGQGPSPRAAVSAGSGARGKA